MRAPVMKQCMAPGCRAWSEEVAHGFECPCCGARPQVTLFWRVTGLVLALACIAVTVHAIWRWTFS